LSRQAEKILSDQYDLRLRVIDLRWLAPLNAAGILEAVLPCRHVLVVDECRITGSQSEALLALFAEQAPDLLVKRIAADDSFIPLGRASTLTLPSRDGIVAAALELVRSSASSTEDRLQRATR
jgi:2-oxoisovalerate dehydrogenase E1 component